MHFLPIRSTINKTFVHPLIVFKYPFINILNFGCPYGVMVKTGYRTCIDTIGCPENWYDRMSGEKLYTSNGKIIIDYCITELCIEKATLCLKN